MKYFVLVLVLALAACAAEPVVEPEPCCEALTADCLSCSEGVSVEEYCISNPETVGCPEPEVIPEPDVVCGDGVCDASEALPEWMMVWDEDLGVEAQAYDVLADECTGSRCVDGSEIRATCYADKTCGNGCPGECVIPAELSYCAEDC